VGTGIDGPIPKWNDAFAAMAWRISPRAVMLWLRAGAAMLAVCAGEDPAACGPCLSRDAEPGAQQRRDWGVFLAEELKVGAAPSSLLEIGSGEGLTGLWFLKHANARCLMTLQTQRRPPCSTHQYAAQTEILDGQLVDERGCMAARG
jgi:hypothetical protein